MPLLSPSATFDYLSQEQRPPQETGFGLKQQRDLRLLSLKILKTFLVAQWLRFHLPTWGGVGLLPCGEAKMPHASQPKKKKKKRQKQYSNKFTKTKNCPHQKHLKK